MGIAFGDMRIPCSSNCMNVETLLSLKFIVVIYNQSSQTYSPDGNIRYVTAAMVTTAIASTLV
jgi:hypothetical protein